MAASDLLKAHEDFAIIASFIPILFIIFQQRVHQILLYRSYLFDRKECDHFFPASASPSIVSACTVPLHLYRYQPCTTSRA